MNFKLLTIHRLVKHAFVRKFAGGMVAQGLLSATNLIIKIWLARETSKEDFGLFVVAFSTILIFESVQNAMINGPLLVLNPEKSGTEKNHFVSSLATGQYLVVVPLVVLFVLGGVLFGAVTGDFMRIRWMYVMLFVVPVYWMREFSRVLGYSGFRIRKILTMDGVVVVSIGAGLYALHALNALSGVRAVLALGVAYTISAAVGHLITDVTYTVDWGKLKQTFRETWTYSRWALVGVVAAAVQSSGYVYVVSLVQDLAITADVSAARTLMMPYLLLISSSQRIFLSKASQIRSTNMETRFVRFILYFASFFIGVWAVYVPLLVFFQEKLIALVYTEKYIRINVYIVYWAVLSLLVAARFITSYSLQAYKDFKHLALYGSVSASLTITLCVFFLFLFGSVGALVALIIGESVLLGLSCARMLTLLRAHGGAGMFARLRESAGNR